MIAENIKQYKKATEELIDFVINRINQGDTFDKNKFEDRFRFELNSVTYDIVQVDKPDWMDEGKYLCQDIKYQLVSFNPSVNTPYPTEINIIDKFDLFINISVELDDK